MSKNNCPSHGLMVQQRNQFGSVWICTYPGCTVKRWNGPTSTPADDATRDARNKLHNLFDPLWQDEHGPFALDSRGRGQRRKAAYSWLAEKMELPLEQMHFGMFDSKQCAKAKVFLGELINLSGWKDKQPLSVTLLHRDWHIICGWLESVERDGVLMSDTIREFMTKLREQFPVDGGNYVKDE